MNGVGNEWGQVLYFNISYDNEYAWLVPSA